MYEQLKKNEEYYFKQTLVLSKLTGILESETESGESEDVRKFAAKLLQKIESELAIVDEKYMP